MTNLVFKNETGKPVTNSLLIAEKFGKRHDHVIRDIKNLIDSTQNWGQLFVPTTYIDSSGKSNPMFIMNRDGFTLLAMGFTGEKALSFKLEYISAFNKMEQSISNGIDFTDPNVILQIVQNWKVSDEKAKLLEADNYRKQEIIDIQHETINELAPKAEYTDKVLTSNNVITTTQIAKELGYSAKTLNKILNKMYIQYKMGGQWVLYSKYQNKGYTKTHTFTDDINGNTRTWHTTVWTEKGRKFIHEMISIYHSQLI